MYNAIMETSEKLIIIQQISGLTQNELAGHLGVSFAALNRWINNHAKPRKAALTNIDKLYREYTGQQEIPKSLLVAKKSIIEMKRISGIDVLKIIMANVDIKDQFLLDLTYQSNKIEGSKLTENETAAILFQIMPCLSSLKPKIPRLHLFICLTIYINCYQLTRS